MLFFSSTIGFSQSFGHGFGHVVSIEYDFTFWVSGSTADDLDEGCGGSEESFFVCIQDSDERDFGQIDSFSQ